MAGVHAGRDTDRDASINPRPVKRGNAGSGEWPCYGRRIASINPRPVKRGNCLAAHDLLAQIVASINPRPVKRGNYP